MKLKRIVTAESKSGVVIQADTFDTTAIEFLTNIWGFDRVPSLPLRPDQVLGDYQPKSIFGPHGGIRSICLRLRQRGPARRRNSNAPVTSISGPHPS